jgi:hypothetical protein
VKRAFILWGLLAAVPAAAILTAIGVLAYWTVPVVTAYVVQGQPLIAFDREIGFVPYPNTVSQRTEYDPNGNQRFSYHVFNDRRGARVTRPGEQAPDHPDILFIGDSFTWGHGVENEQIFAHLTPLALEATGANLSMGSYGTTQSLQMLRRNIDLKPRVIVYSFIEDHFARNMLPCARAYYPFCLDVSHVVFDADRRPRIAPPWSDGVTRAQLQVKGEREWLDPLTWIVHGVDVIYGRVLWAEANKTLLDRPGHEKALEFLLGELAKTSRSIGAHLLFVHLSQGAKAPDVLVNSAAKLGVPLLDLWPAYQAYQATAGAPSLVLAPTDSHPNAAGHALIASEIASFIRNAGWLKESGDAKATLQTGPATIAR